MLNFIDLADNMDVPPSLSPAAELAAENDVIASIAKDDHNHYEEEWAANNLNN